jgi:redox-sensitive bicupin YhaK (pirin superfamily)
VDGIAADPCYLDISVPPRTRRSLPVETDRSAFAYVFGGSGRFGNASTPRPVRTEAIDGETTAPGEAIGDHSLILFDRGDEVVVETEDEGIRFLLVSGKPIREPIAWQGPIVMNTRGELEQAFREFRDGTFLKHQSG